ncbi:DNA-binding transcriptional regulator, LysR family [Sphingomonas laterariae]|uniref:DNA-binding transcriptional regulator, LysR family n=1 Tax=Edaphosphingomonas laterariae TaxID=861865 RepID=A0A239DEP4_9SPHN|nr:LysR family transcriptional regulator [Sphingomonas laterariae]SNS30830.1 DNA-binding transcriptional regulator, LysR family [Sphingomonas laterariae]
MDLRQLLYFTTLADTLNFHRAAERLNISQPPLTVAIRKLEEQLGAQLFVRGPRGVALTAAGQAALEPARAALARAQDVRAAVRQGQTGERGQLRIGFVGSAIYSMLPRLIPDYRHRFPLVDLVLEDSTSVDIARGLRDGELDVGLVRLPLLDAKGLTIKVVETDELIAAVPAKSAFAASSRMALASLAREPFILHTRISVLNMVALMACHEAGFTPNVAQEATQVHTILSLVQSGLGVALVPARATRQVPDGVRLVRLENPPRIEAGIAIPDQASPAAINFLTMATSDS